MASSKVMLNMHQRMQIASYMQTNAHRLMTTRLTDEEFARELTKELGYTVTRCNARWMRLKAHIVANVTRDGVTKTELVTWRPIQTHSPGERSPYGKFTTRLQNLEGRLRVIENILISLGCNLKEHQQ